MTISLDTLSTREGVLMYPNQAAAILANAPPGSTHTEITDEVLATRAGCLRFPNEAAAYIAELIPSS